VRYERFIKPGPSILFPTGKPENQMTEETPKRRRGRPKKNQSLSEPKGSQVVKAPPEKPEELDGVVFVDDKGDPRELNAQVEETKERTVASDSANQEAAKKVVERLRYEVPQIKKVTVDVPKATDEEQQKAKPTVYRVISSPGPLARGASTFELKRGKLITNRDYDIEGLIAQGVQLEEFRV